MHCGTALRGFVESERYARALTGWKRVIESKQLDVLRLLMDQHGLSQANLPELGTQGVVSEILNGKRELNLRQVKALAARFKVPPTVFI